MNKILENTILPVVNVLTLWDKINVFGAENKNKNLKQYILKLNTSNNKFKSFKF